MSAPVKIYVIVMCGVAAYMLAHRMNDHETRIRFLESQLAKAAN